MTLTREAILALEAGREMDALIAERVFGLNVVCRDYPYQRDDECGFVNPTNYPDMPDIEWAERGPVCLCEGGIWPPEPVEGFPSLGPTRARVEGVLRYSTDIADAWLVFERFAASQTWRFENVFCGNSPEGLGMFIVGYHDGRQWVITPGRWVEAPATICKAALLAAMGQEA